jgi:ABC-type polysaccharide/polyol phosphate export permease
MYSVQSFVFRKFLNIEVPNYSLFLLCGLLPWIFIVMSIDMITPVLDSSRELLKSFNVRPIIIALSRILDNFVNFVFAFLIILIPTWGFSDFSFTGIFFIPISLVFLIVGTFGLCYLLAVLQIFYKDVRFITSFIISILFFLTPIFYPVEYVPVQYRFLIDFNPIFALIEPFRYCIYDYSFNVLMLKLLKSALVAFSFAGLSLFFWRRKRNDFYIKL